MKAVLFDLDHTLWYSPRAPDFDHITRLQAARVASVLPEAGTETFIRTFWAEWQRADAERRVDDLRETAWSVVMAATCSDLALRASEADRRRVWEAINAVPRTAFHTEPVDGAIEMLGALRRSGWRLAIVSNYPLESALLRPHIDACGLGARIDVVVTSADTGLRKPHARPFLDALAALDSTVGDAVMVGDSWVNDVAPAIDLGMMAVHFSAEGDPELAPPHARIQTLAELPGLLGIATPQ